MTTIRMNHGTEGPRHDPYSYEEITVRRPDGREVTIHSGLAYWVKVKGNAIPGTCTDPIEANALFERHAGITPERAAKAYRTLHERRVTHHACGVQHIKCVDGYPGETFTVCGKCGNVLDSSFNIGAVI